MNNIPRNTTWLSQASLLIIDNPVGTGFSYTLKTLGLSRQIADMPSTFPIEDNDLAHLYARHRHVAIYQKPSLYTFMNTNFRRKLGIIPRNVV